MLKNQVLRTFFKDSLKLFSGTKFCLVNGNSNINNGFFNLFSMKALCTYVQYRSYRPIICVFYCFSEHFIKTPFKRSFSVWNLPKLFLKLENYFLSEQFPNKPQSSTSCILPNRLSRFFSRFTFKLEVPSKQERTFR